jgi:hypothetical protein
MAVELFGEDVEIEGTKVPWPDAEGVSFVVRPIPPVRRQKFERDINRGMKTRQLADMPMEQTSNRAITLTRKCGAYALVDSEGFELTTRSPQVAKAIGEALGREVKPGDTVRLDGLWTEEVKSEVFRFLPRLPAWLDDAAEDVAKSAAKQETAKGKT